MRNILTTLTLLFCFVAAPVAAKPIASVEAFYDLETSEQLGQLLESLASPVQPLLGITRFLLPELIGTLYEQRDFRPLWFNGGSLRAEARMMLEALRESGSEGLCGNDELLAGLEDLLRRHNDFARSYLPLAAGDRALIELYLSQAFLTYATQMVEGQVDPSLAHVDWNVRRRRADLIKLLEYAVTNHRLTQVLEDLKPPHEGYRLLRGALEEYRRLAALGGWPQIPVGPTIRPGDADERIPPLRSLLLTTGDLAGLPALATTLYDQETEAALRRFQARHGLVDDGVVGPKTLDALIVPVEERVRQIELNLERWRWMPKSFGPRHIRVNIADFSLTVVEDDRVVMQMPVIVGTQYRKTPVFSAAMTYLEFAPYWTVPPTILREDKLPLIKRNPAYLRDKHYRIISWKGDKFIDPEQVDWSSVTASNFPGMLRMEPGPWNPLGRVKFMFPNPYNVYLHDTNEAGLFENYVRSFSSGCIRIKRPRDLAVYLLEKQLGPKKLQELFEATRPQKVPIKAIPVHIQYWTAWVDADGRAHFRPDVYFRDLDLDIALTEPAYRVMEQLQAGSLR